MTDTQGRIVVGFDGSDSSRAAVSWAADEAAARNRGLLILHALMPPVSAVGLGVGLPPGPELLEALEVAARAQLADVAAEIHGVDVATRVAVGSPSGVLIDAAEDAALVVVGSRGRGGFSGLLLGSTGAQVASHAASPVAVLRRPAPVGARQLVVGIDGSRGAEAALAYAFDVASHHRWEVAAVHAWDVPAYDLLVVPNGPVPVPLADVADEEIRLAAEVLAGFREAYPDVRVEERLVRGAPVAALLDAAANAAAIVVGSRGHGPALGALLGSVTHGVLHKAKLPVIVVPPATEELSAA